MIRNLWGFSVLVVGLLPADGESQKASEKVYPGKSWTAKEPKEVGMNAEKLAALRDYVGGRGCIVRHGHLVFSWGDASKRGDVASACKPWFVHFLLLLLQQGTIKSLDEPVYWWEPGLTELNPALGYKDRKITWKHLANQTSGYGVLEKPGTAFDYNDYNMALFADTLFTKVYKTPWEKVDATILRPKLTNLLECEDEPTFMVFGSKGPQGRLGISVRDFARFGWLYLNKGRWKDQQLIQEKWVTLATTSPLPASLLRTTAKKAEMIKDQRTLGGGINQTDHRGSYSFAWWTNGTDALKKRHWPDAPLDISMASGHFGKRVCAILPSLDVVICWNDATIKGPEMENQALKLLKEACGR